MSVLHELTLADQDQLLRWRNDPDIRRAMYTDHVISEAEHDQWFQGVFDDPTRKYWIISDGRGACGTAYLTDISPQHRRCSWGFYLGRPDSRGNGVSALAEYEVLSYVFDGMVFRKLCCEVLEFNHAVIRGHRRFGFREDGVLRQHIFKEGFFVDVVLMSLLKDEWETKKLELLGFIRKLEARLGVTVEDHGGTQGPTP